MDAHHINRPDGEAMARILNRHRLTPAGTILRLAWQLGLQREEITGLTWEKISFPDHLVCLPDREVPLDGELETYLRQLRDQQGGRSPYVVISGKYGKNMAPQAVSRLARGALDEEGMINIRLADLRQDYIIRQLQQHDCSYVARITGLEIRTLQLRFSKYAGDNSGKARTSRQGSAIDEFRLWRVLQAEKGTPAGLALWLAWDLGLGTGEIAALTWQQVDLNRRTIRLPDREVPLTNTVRRLLEEHRARRGADDHVILSERSRKSMDISRLSRVTRSLLVQGGLERVTLRDLQLENQKRPQEAALLEAVRARGFVDRNQAVELLGVPKTAAYDLLRYLTEKEKLVRVGRKYYLPENVAPPERHREQILAYIAREGMACRQDIAQLLHIEVRQCSLLLKHMTDAGDIRRVNQKYYLNDTEM